MVTILIAIFIMTSFAISIWPYMIIAYITVAALLITLTHKQSQFNSLTKFGVPTALISGCILAAFEPLLVISKGNTFISLSSAQGLVIQRDPLLIAFAMLGALYVVFHLKNRFSANPAFPSVVIGALFAAATLTFMTKQAGVLGEYGVAKLQFIGIVFAIIAGFLYFANMVLELEEFRVALLFSITMFSAVNFVPQLSAITAWPSSFSAGGTGLPGNALRNEIQNMSESNLACIPKNDDSREKAYVCNRWASALSSTNSEMDFLFRAALLGDTRDLKVIVEDFKAKGFFIDRRLAPIEEILGVDTK